MTDEQAKEILQGVQYNFASKLDSDQVSHWYNFLQSQPFGTSKKALDWFTYDSGNKFVPSISEFVGRVREEQAIISRQQALNVDSSKCGDCRGLTWVSDDPTGVKPCPSCRTASFSRWSEAAFNVGTPPNQDELEGPRQSYQIAARDNHNTGPIVEVARAQQWVEHIKKMTEDTTVYPEGEIIPELVEISRAKDETYAF